MSHPVHNNTSVLPHDHEQTVDLNGAENVGVDSPRLTHKLNSKLVNQKRKSLSPVKRFPLQSKDKNVLTGSLKKQNLFQNINKQSQNWLKNSGGGSVAQSNKLKKYGSILGLIEDQEPIKLQLPRSKSIILKDDNFEEASDDDDDDDDADDESESENDLNPLQLKLQLQLNNRNKLRFDREIEVTSTPIDAMVDEPVGYTQFSNDDILKLNTYSSIDVTESTEDSNKEKGMAQESPIKLLPLEVPLDVDSSDNLPQMDPMKKPNVPKLDNLNHVDIFSEAMPQFEPDGLSNDDINDLLDDL